MKKKISLLFFPKSISYFFFENVARTFRSTLWHPINNIDNPKEDMLLETGAVAWQKDRLYSDQLMKMMVYADNGKCDEVLFYKGLLGIMSSQAALEKLESST